jgi:hypothetical protein
MNDNFRMLSREQKDFCDLHAGRIDEGKDVWLERGAWSNSKQMLDAFVAWQKEQAANPAIPKIQKGIDEAKAILGKDEGKERGFVSAVEGPFILLLAYTADGDDEEKVKKELAEKGARYAKSLKRLWEKFEKRFRAPLGLPEMERGRYYYQVILSTRADFARFIRGGTGYDADGDVAGFFAPRTKWAGVRVGTQENEAKYATQDLAHEAVHQLHAHYSRDPKLKALSYFDEWTGIWFTEGWAEYLGGGLDGLPKRRVDFLRACATTACRSSRCATWSSSRASVLSGATCARPGSPSFGTTRTCRNRRTRGSSSRRGRSGSSSTPSPGSSRTSSTSTRTASTGRSTSTS